MLKILLFAAGGYGLLVAGVYLMQGRMLYLSEVPGRERTATPAAAGMAYEDVFLQTGDGVRVHGWFVPGDGDRILLFFHGNAGNISHRIDSIRQFRGLGLSVFIIDYRGYGQSGGRTTESGMYLDAEAAWDYLISVRGADADQILIFGRSLGASVAARLAERHPPLGLIVESSFTSVPDVAGEIYPWLPVRVLSRLKHATRDYIQDVRCPVLVVHSRDDEIIPFSHGQAIFEAAPEPRMFLELRGTHNDAHLRHEGAYLRGLSAFLESLPGS
ncbi:MAG: alpha/beta hydrolase [Gammaproteobacteria bacterium]|jgi:hypothetical protein